MSETTFSIVGSGGDGAVAAGDILSMACARDGLHVIKTEAYGPQIRGGESSCTVRISSSRIYAQSDEVDALIVFNWADFGRFRSEISLSKDAFILHEADDKAPDEISSGGTRQVIPVPFNKLAPKGKNILALGILAELFGLPAGAIRAAIAQRFAKKAQAVIDANLAGFDRGVAYCSELPKPAKRLDYVKAPAQLLMSGNEASAVAAIDAGCRFFAGYPITPSSEILHFLADWLPKIGGSTLQTEDELAAIGAVVGGSFAGVKSMTATSGPGLSLMAEILGLSSIAEIPAVIVNVQRGGPSTGIPTKSEQSDLMHALYASHGDTPRVVLACNDVEDSYHATVDAFNIAEEFQIPVILLSDQSIAQRRETIRPESLEHEVIERRLAHDLTEYKRYRLTDDGVSPMTVPGQAGGMFQTNGLEHDEQGRPNSMHIVHERMNEKRFRKLDAIAKKYSKLFTRFGPAKADIGILCWGSSTGPVREAVDQLNAEGIRVAAFVPKLLMPLPVTELEKFISDCEQLVVLELSYSKQFYTYLRTQVDLPKNRTHVYARSGGSALRVSEVLHQVKSQVKLYAEVTA